MGAMQQHSLPTSLEGAQSGLQCTLKSKCGVNGNIEWCERNRRNMESQALVCKACSSSVMPLINSLLITFTAK